MLNIRNITAHLIATTIVASGIAYFPLDISWAKDGGHGENRGGTVSVHIDSPKDGTSVDPCTHSAACKDTATSIIFSPPSPLPDAWVITEPSPEKSDTSSNKGLPENKI